MRGVKVAEVCTSCELLIEQQQFNQAVSVLEAAHLNIDDRDDADKLFKIFERLPELYFQNTISIALLFAQVLSRTQRMNELLEFSFTILERYGLAHAASITVIRSVGLAEMNRQPEARKLLEQAIPHLSGEMLGAAWARLGLTRFQLGEPWLEGFQHARSFLSGIELGKALLNEGACFVQSNQIGRAHV